MGTKSRMRMRMTRTLIPKNERGDIAELQGYDFFFDHTIIFHALNPPSVLRGLYESSDTSG